MTKKDQDDKYKQLYSYSKKGLTREAAKSGHLEILKTLDGMTCDNRACGRESKSSFNISPLTEFEGISIRYASYNDWCCSGFRRKVEITCENLLNELPLQG